MVATYYDWERQANLVVDTPDKDTHHPLWDYELGSGDSYYFHPHDKSCEHIKMPGSFVQLP